MKAIITMGLPASGKSTTMETYHNDYTRFDSDEIKKEHPEYDPKQPELIHEWSKKEMEKRLSIAIANGTDKIAIDTTGTNSEKYVKMICELQSKGYDVTLVYCQVRLSTAIERNAKRQRSVPESIIRDKFDTITYAFDILSRYADSIETYQND